MYKRILIASALASTLLIGSAMASGHYGMKGSSTCNHGSMKNSSMCSKQQQNKGHHSQHKKQFVKKVIDAVSKTGIDSAQAQKVTDAINTFKQAKMAMKQQGPVCPLDAFKGDNFDKKVFRETMLSKPDAMISARADMLESIYAVLNEEQRKLFTREFTAHMIEKTIKKNMIKGYMMPKRGMMMQQQQQQ
ncbi:MAG: Spy/CpxP family protein refolding chaperone [Sulfurovum sp.]|jgi:hypothetical protein|nr:Spy/CpxP family protein refolding chaperone [Sulfurovum sp.]